MSLVDHVDDIAYASTFEIDKIFSEKFSGSFTALGSGGAGFAEVTKRTLTQPYGEDVLPVMIWSIDNANWYDGHFSLPVASSLSTRMSATCYTTSTQLVIVATNYTTTNETLYYKVVLVSDD